MKQQETGHGVTRRKFLGTTLGGGATILAGGSAVIFQSSSRGATNPAAGSTYQLGGDLPVNRLGLWRDAHHRAPGIWGYPPDRANALKVLRRAVELGREPDRYRRRVWT